MYALKLELKLNNKERSHLAGCAGLKRFTYNFGLSLILDSWQFEDITASDSKRIDAAKKVFNNELKTSTQFQWINNYPSTVYQSAFQDLKDAFSRWRSGQNDLPVFKTKKGKQSFTVYKTAGIYPEKGKPPLPFTNRQVLHPGTSVAGESTLSRKLSKKITIPGLGEFRLKERIPFTCSAQTFHISREANRWFVSFVIDAEKLPPLFHEVVEPIGIDARSYHFRHFE